MIGTKDSWGATTAASTKHPHYLSSTWSPCGQLIAVVAAEIVEIWDALTLKLFSTLHSTNVATKFKHGLAYSPDGHSLAGCSNTGIVIWDVQTGGEVTQIGCEVTGNGLNLVWSLDGERICTVSLVPARGNITVTTYNVTSGTKISTATQQSRYKPYLWAHEKSFQLATTTQDHKGWTINIFEVGPTLTRIESFLIHSGFPSHDFSPSTYRALVFATGNHHHSPELLILDVRNSEVLLRATGSYQHPSFSPDASVFAASTRSNLFIWRYDSGQYTQWKEFQQTPGPLQFSPASLSLLSRAGALLRVLSLDHSSSAAVAVESTVSVHSQCYDAFSPDGTFVATAYHGGNTVTITNLNPQNPYPSQFIETELEISAIVLTGNVLLVTGSEKIVAWLLTGEGVVDGIVGNTRADYNDSLWDISPKALLTHQHDSDGKLEFSVKDEIAVIYMHGFAIHAYNTGTGEILELNEVSKSLGSTQYSFHHQPGRDDCNHYHLDMCKHQGPLKCEWPISDTALQEGWVKDPEGKHRLWLHARWRAAGSHVDWLENASTLRLKNTSELLIVKF